MGFWLRKTIFGLVLILIAFILLNNLEFVFSLDYKSWFTSDEPEVEQVAEPKAEKTPQDTKKNNKQKAKYNARVLEESNAAAAGLSKFYASINPQLVDGKGPKIKNGVITLPKPTGDLERILEARRMVIRPLPKTWKGSKSNRPFRKDHTLYQKLDEYAKEEGLQVLWRINKDLLVKDAFRINKGILPMAYQIGKAMSGHFANGVNTYFCYQQRNIVVIEGRSKYLDETCTLLDYNPYD